MISLEPGPPDVELLCLPAVQVEGDADVDVVDVDDVADAGNVEFEKRRKAEMIFFSIGICW